MNKNKVFVIMHDEYPMAATSEEANVSAIVEAVKEYARAKGWKNPLVHVSTVPDFSGTMRVKYIEQYENL